MLIPGRILFKINVFFQSLISYGILRVSWWLIITTSCHVTSHVLLDHTGQDRFRSLMRTFARGASGVIIMCDVTRQVTLGGAKLWKQSVDEQLYPCPPTLLLVNKVGLCFQVHTIPPLLNILSLPSSLSLHCLPPSLNPTHLSCPPFHFPDHFIIPLSTPPSIAVWLW